MASMQRYRSILSSYCTNRSWSIMAKLKGRAFQCYVDGLCSHPNNDYLEMKCSQLSFAAVRIPDKMLAESSLALKADLQLCSHLSRTPLNKTRFQSPSRFLFVNPMTIISSFTPSRNGVILGSSHFSDSLKRTFSVNANPIHSENHRCLDESGDKKKTLAAQKGGTHAPAITAAENSKSREVMAEHVNKKPASIHSSTHGQESSAEPKKKKKFKSKNSEKDPSSITADISLKIPNPKAVTQALKTSQKEVLDSLGTPKALPKKNTRSYKKKKSSPKGAVVETDGAIPKVKKNLLQDHKKQKPSDTIKSKQQVGMSFRPLYPPSGKSVLVVESITKAKVIQGYLGNMYEVIPSYGHVRDLAARSGSVRPDEDFSMVWEVPSTAWTHLKSIKVAISRADNLILASDPDREGEAIAWHIIEMLEQQDSLRKDLTIARVVFHEITESAIKKALQSPRDIDHNLVHAYLARRALDYLIGFNISPLLWRKLPGCQSAGRVQSAALALICDREIELDEFKPQEYWTVETQFGAKKLELSEGEYLVPAHLTHFNSKKLSQLSVASETEAKNIEQILTSSKFKVISVKKGNINRNPFPPYITSTLQQDAANKLNFSAIHTMKLAQKLYEGVQMSNSDTTGLITYLRTDGLHISDEAAQNIRSLVIERYGDRFASPTPRKYFKKVKNAQEAHEAIRPTDIRRLPSMLAGMLDEDSLKLYTLIWSRTVACQMEPSKIAQLQVNIGNDEESVMLRASCSSLEFLGYKAVYEDGEAKELKGQEIEKDDHNKKYPEILSDLKSGDVLNLGKVDLKQHHTQGPPRYSEASLVKKLEELGIGRPSTYATTIRVLQDRKYMMTKNRVLYPEFRGRMVSAFLMHYFSEVMDYSFTADMETELDNVSTGLTEWKGLLKDYWTRFRSYCNHVATVDIHQVEKMLERTFEDSLFTSFPDRTCPSCFEGLLVFKVSKFGAGYFIGCDQHPRCKYIAKTLYGAEGDDDEDDGPEKSGSVEEPKLLGLHPVSKEKVLLKNGPYGAYVQLGEDKKGYSPKRSSVSQLKDVSAITLEDALELLRYPITLGYHPDDDRPIILKLARVGFTIRYRRHIATVPKNTKPSDITMEKALKLLAGKGVRRSGRPKKQPKSQDEDDEDDEAVGAY